MISRRGVLLVGHDASRTGAPVAALTWLRWLERTHPGPTQVWLDRGGPLEEAFAATAPTRTLNGWRHEPARRRTGRSAPRWTRGALSGAERLLGHVRHGFDEPPVVIANTVAAWASAAAATPRARLVVWVHELDHTADRIVPPDVRADLIRQTDVFIAVGERIATMLRERWQVPAGRIAVVDSFVDALPADLPATSAAIDVLGAGSLTPRKGPDAFVAALALMAGGRQDLTAAWVGGSLDAPTATMVRHDLVEAGLAERVRLVGEEPTLEAWWPASGILLHTAREDPAPLVVLEAAQRGVPVVTWDTGGAADLLEAAGCGDLVAPAGDLMGLARRAQLLLDDRAGRQEAGRMLRAAVANRSTDVQAPALYASMMDGVS